MKHPGPRVKREVMPPVNPPGPDLFNTFFREFDEFFTSAGAFDAAFTFSSLARNTWPGFAANPNLNAWTNAIAAQNTKELVRYLSDNQLRIIVKFFGNPADQAALNQAFWLFGKDALPPDDQRPNNPHRMDGDTQWLVWLACADASVRLAMKPALWAAAAKAIALGLVGDSLFRNRLQITRYSKQDPNVQSAVTADFANLSGNRLLDALIGLGREANFGAS